MLTPRFWGLLPAALVLAAVVCAAPHSGQESQVSPHVTEDKESKHDHVQSEHRPSVNGQGFQSEHRPSVNGQGFQSEHRPSVNGQGFQSEHRPSVNGQGFQSEHQPSVSGQGFQSEQRPSVSGQGFQSEHRPSVNGQGFQSEHRPSVSGQGFQPEHEHRDGLLYPISSFFRRFTRFFSDTFSSASHAVQHAVGATGRALHGAYESTVHALRRALAWLHGKEGQKLPTGKAVMYRFHDPNGYRGVVKIIKLDGTGEHRSREQGNGAETDSLLSWNGHELQWLSRSKQGQGLKVTERGPKGIRVTRIRLVDLARALSNLTPGTVKVQIRGKTWEDLTIQLQVMHDKNKQGEKEADTYLSIPVKRLVNTQHGKDADWQKDTKESPHSEGKVLSAVEDPLPNKQSKLMNHKKVQKSSSSNSIDRNQGSESQHAVQQV